MRLLVVAGLVAACKAAPGATEPSVLSNRATGEAPDLTPATTCRLAGVVRDLRTGEAIAGATLIGTGAATSETAISDEAGRYALDADPRHDQLIVYYADLTRELSLRAPCRGVPIIWLDPVGH